MVFRLKYCARLSNSCVKNGCCNLHLWLVDKDEMYCKNKWNAESMVKKLW